MLGVGDLVQFEKDRNEVVHISDSNRRTGATSPRIGCKKGSDSRVFQLNENEKITATVKLLRDI